MNPPLKSQCRERLEQSFEIMKMFRAKMVKYGRKIFFTRGLYTSPGTLVGLSQDLPYSFHEIPGKVLFAIVYTVIRMQRLASLDSKNFGPKYDFPILFLRFL